MKRLPTIPVAEHADRALEALRRAVENVVLGGTHHGIECREALQAMGVA